MKTILIPSDFSVDSLKVLKYYLEENQDQQKLKIIFLNSVYHSNDITDLLFYNKNKQINHLLNEPFLDALSIIKNKYKNTIETTVFDVFSGYMQSSFNDYLVRNKVDKIVFSDKQKLTRKVKNSFDLKPFIKKSVIEKFTVSLENEDYVPEKNQVASIFNMLIPIRN